jgi:hypothetical protein
MSDNKLIPIRYIGKKPSMYDTVLNRPRLRWEHQGDVKWVPEDDARIYVRYTDIWAVANDLELSAAPSIFGTPATESSALAPAAGSPAAPLPGRGEETSSDGAGAEDPDEDPEDDETVPAPQFSAEEAQKRIEDIIKVYKHLKKRDYGRNGKPKATRLSQLLRRQVYSAERDAAHAIVEKAIRQRLSDSVPPISAPAVVETAPATDTPSTDIDAVLAE